MFPALHKHSDWGLLILRAAIGAIFLYHGIGKWQMEDASMTMTILKFAEPLGGIALIAGVLTQLAALGLSIIMLGAIYMKATGFGQASLDLIGTFGTGAKWEFDLMVLAGCITLLLMGAGRLSADHALKR